jgi:hypothetical protein
MLFPFPPAPRPGNGFAVPGYFFPDMTYGGFTCTKETHSAKLGPIVLQVKEKETVYVPIILSAAAIALGALLLVAFRSK